VHSKIRKIIRSLLVLLVTLTSLAACSSNQTGRKTLTIAREIATDNINYLTNESSNNAQVIDNFSEGLLTYDKDGQLTGGLAETWEHKDNIYTFTLRKNLKWSNDTPLTAADFVFSWQTLASLAEAPYRYFMAELAEGEAIIKGEKQATDLGVKALSDTVLEVTLVHDSAYALGMLAQTTFLPLNEAFYKEVGADNYGTSAESVLASGPFRLTEYNAALGYTLVKNDNYWNAENIALDEVNTRVIKESATQDTLYQNNELDVLEVPATLYDKYATYQGMIEIPYARLYYFYVSGNTGTPAPLLANADFRTALSYAIDKQILATNVFKDGSQPLDYLVPRNFGNVDGVSFRTFTGEGVSESYKFNVSTAQQYLAKAKAALGDGDLSFTIAYQEKEENKRVFENIAAQLETNLPGVKVTLHPLPGQIYFKELMKQMTPAGYAGWMPDYEDVATYFQVFLADNSLNFSKYNNPTYDKLYAEGQLERDVVKRAELFKKAEKLLLDDAFIIPLSQRGKRYVVKQHVKGFNYNSISPEINFRYITIE